MDAKIQEQSHAIAKLTSEMKKMSDELSTLQAKLGSERAISEAMEGQTTEESNVVGSGTNFVLVLLDLDQYIVSFILASILHSTPS
jgi:hypothetical protein